VDHLVHLLRHVYTNREEARAKGAAARQHMQRQFNPDKLAESVAAQLERISGLLAARAGEGSLQLRA
jgi:hypothetical protein